MNIVEFFISNDRHGYRYNDCMKEILKNTPIEYKIDIFDIVQFEQSWEKYHHNQTWGYFGYMNEKNEVTYLFPRVRVDLECFLEALKSEREQIDYELYVTFARKYFHVKYRRIE
jgi:hypothetical protein